MKNRNNVHINKYGILADKFGRTLETDWKKFDRIRKKSKTPALNAIRPI